MKKRYSNVSLLSVILNIIVLILVVVTFIFILKTECIVGVPKFIIVLALGMSSGWLLGSTAAKIYILY